MSGAGPLRSSSSPPGYSFWADVFAYFVVFRYGLTFLLGIGSTNYVTPMVTISEYFDLFVNVMLGVGLVFELPVLIFFLTLLRILSPVFLLRHSRYAILGIFILAAIVTPTPDVFNLMLFAAPMCLLFYIGIFASYLLVLNREQRQIPVEDLQSDRIGRTVDTGGHLILGHYQVRLSLGTEMAVSNYIDRRQPM